MTVKILFEPLGKGEINLSLLSLAPKGKSLHGTPSPGGLPIRKGYSFREDIFVKDPPNRYYYRNVAVIGEPLNAIDEICTRVSIVSSEGDF